MFEAPVVAARQPLLRAPGIILALIAIMALAHGWRATLSDEADFSILARFCLCASADDAFPRPCASAL